MATALQTQSWSSPSSYQHPHLLPIGEIPCGEWKHQSWLRYDQHFEPEKSRAGDDDYYLICFDRRYPLRLRVIFAEDFARMSFGLIPEEDEESEDAVLVGRLDRYQWRDAIEYCSLLDEYTPYELTSQDRPYDSPERIYCASVDELVEVAQQRGAKKVLLARLGRLRRVRHIQRLKLQDALWLSKNGFVQAFEPMHRFLDDQADISAADHLELYLRYPELCDPARFSNQAYLFKLIAFPLMLFNDVQVPASLTKTFMSKLRNILERIKQR